jgi:hypothetical protein
MAFAGGTSVNRPSESDSADATTTLASADNSTRASPIRAPPRLSTTIPASDVCCAPAFRGATLNEAKIIAHGRSL